MKRNLDAARGSWSCNLLDAALKGKKARSGGIIAESACAKPTGSGHERAEGPALKVVNVNR